MFDGGVRTRRGADILGGLSLFDRIAFFEVVGKLLLGEDDIAQISVS